jgi:hypothetical protein
VAKGGPKLNPELRLRLCQDLEDGLTRTAAVARAGISYDTFRRWMNDQSKPENVVFSEAVKKAEQDAVAKAVGHVRDAMPDTWQAAAWWLERKFPEHWGSERKVVKELRRQVAELQAMLAGKASAAEEVKKFLAEVNALEAADRDAPPARNGAALPAAR